jgi:2-succinyl-5-enolpyruvyl-6-hydroxy-3-cyclohexene-1-carboxylate synthase
VITPHGYPDPQGSAETLIVADVETTLSRLASALELRVSRAGGRASRFAAHVARCNRAAWPAIDGALAGSFGLSEGAAVRAVVEHLPDGAVLAVGNSLPVRHVDAFCRSGSAVGITVVSQRGAAGIDGVVSSAAGTADVAERPTVLLVGDVSALHDLGGLAVARTATVPFVIVVLNNDGGRIFEQLPLSRAGLAEEAWPFWTTPHGQSFEAAATLFGLPFALARTEAELVEHLAAALERAGATLLEVKVPPHGARATSDAVARAVDAALAPLALLTESP